MNLIDVIEDAGVSIHDDEFETCAKSYIKLMNDESWLKENLKESVPEFGIGDTVRVSYKIKEGNKERIQAYEGVVIARKNGSVRESFTVRRVSFGVGVERTFPLHSPKIEKIEVVKKGKVRRAKLFYLRDLTGKATKIKEQK